MTILYHQLCPLLMFKLIYLFLVSATFLLFSLCLSPHHYFSQVGFLFCLWGFLGGGIDQYLVSAALSGTVGTFCLRRTHLPGGISVVPLSLVYALPCLTPFGGKSRPIYLFVSVNGKYEINRMCILWVKLSASVLWWLCDFTQVSFLNVLSLIFLICKRGKRTSLS